MIAWTLIFLLAAFALATLIANAMSRAGADTEPDLGYTEDYDPPLEDRALSRAFLDRYQETQP